VFAPACPDRARVVPGTRAAAARNTNDCGEASAADRQRSLTWAQRLKRVFAIDIEVCRRCGGRVRVIASIEDPEVIERILDHLGGAKRRRRQSRAPPELDRLIDRRNRSAARTAQRRRAVFGYRLSADRVWGISG
jgi:hypothetical protein